MLLERRLLVGADVHGCYDELMTALDMCKYDPTKDCFISLGDLTDRGPHSNKVVDFFATQKFKDPTSVITIRGNHDIWMKQYLHNKLNGDSTFPIDLSTRKSYAEEDLSVMVKHLHFLQTQESYRIIEYDNLEGGHTEAVFIHGGFNRHYYIGMQNDDIYCWDRDLWSGALAWNAMHDKSKKDYPYKNKDNIKEVFIGHTPTIHWGCKKPMQAAYIHNLDTGCVFGNAYSIMDVRTKEIWQAEKK